MTSVVKSLSDLIASAKEVPIKDLVLPAVMNKCDAAIAGLDSTKRLIALMLENGKGDVASMMKDSKESKVEATACSKIMRAQLVVAKSLVVAN